MKRLFLIVITIMLIGCTTKMDVMKIGDDTLVFTKGVDTFYYVDAEGNKREVTE